MLSQLLVSHVYIFLIIFARIGAAMMVLPGVGEPYVSPRIRLTLALAISLLLTARLGTALPPLPLTVMGLAIIIVQEVIVGIFIGTLVNILTSAMHTTGMILSYQSGLSSAVLFDMSQATQGTAIGNFLGILALTLIFALDLHHVLLQGVVESYTLFVPGHPLPFADFADSLSSTLSKTFAVAIKLSAPLIVTGLLLSIAAGVLSRLMPIMPVFFIIVSPQVLLGFFIIMISLSGIMLWYIQYFEDSLRAIF